MNPYSSNTSSSNPEIQKQYAQQQAERQRATQQRAEQNPPVGRPPEQAPRMVQGHRQQRDAVRDEMDIDTGDDDVRPPKRKREEESELTEGEERTAKKIRLDPPLEVGPDVRVVARGDVAETVPAVSTAPLTSEALKKAIQSDDLETVIYLLDAGVLMGKRLEEELMYAAEEGSTATVRELLRRGANVNAVNKFGYTALMYAASKGNVDVALVLLNAGASPSVEDREESPAIVLAVIAGSTALVRALLKYGADIDEPDGSDGRTALMMAAEEDDDEIFSLLLNAQANIHLKDNNGLTALAVATLHGSTDMLEQLLKLGADINHRFNVYESPGTTVLICAVGCENFEKAKLLLAWGADVNISNGSGTSPLMSAVKIGNEELFTLILRANANIHAADNEGNTALTYAVKEGNVAMVEQLLTLGANINAPHNYGNTVLMLAAELGHEKIFNLLIEKRADIHATTRNREAVLMYAIKGGSEAIMNTLVSLGADIHARTSNGETALTHAIGWGRVEMLRLLLALRVNVNTADHAGNSPLMEAASRGNAGMFSLLLQAGASLMSVNSMKKTMLMCAVQGGNLWVVQAILNCAPNIDAVDNAGQTALMLAVKYKRLDILHLLLQYGAHVNLRGTQVDNATVIAIEQENMPALELLLAYDGEPYDLTSNPPPHLSDMRQRRALLKPGIAADAMMLEALYGIPISSMPEISATHSVHEALTQIFTELQICSPIAGRIKGQLGDQPDGSNKLMQVLAGMGGILSQSQKSMAIAGLLASLNAWVKSWPKDWTPYKSESPGTSLSVHVDANLTALVKLQVEKLVELGEQMEMKMAIGLETLMTQCEKYTQVKNGELVIDDEKLLAYLAGELGLYSPLFHLVAAAWFDALQDQQQRILAAIKARQQRILDQRKQFESNSLDLGWDLSGLVDFYASTWTDALPATSIRFAFSEEGIESALLAAFGAALKQIDTVEGGTLLRSSTLQGELADVYADLMFRQLHMLMQYADQASAAS